MIKERKNCLWKDRGNFITISKSWAAVTATDDEYSNLLVVYDKWEMSKNYLTGHLFQQNGIYSQESMINVMI